MTDEPRAGEGCPGATSWGNGYDGSTSRYRVKCECGFLVEGLDTAEAAEDTYRWHQGLKSALGGDL